MGLLQREEALADLLVIRAGETLHNQSERPDHVAAYVRPARPWGGLADAVVGVAVGQDELARVEVQRVARPGRVDIRQRKQAWDVAVVNAVVIPVAVYLVREYAPELLVDDDRVLAQRALDLVGQGAAAGCGFLVAMDPAEHLRRLAQADDGKEVRRDQEWENGRVVARPEHGADQPHRFDWMAITAAGQGIGLHLCAPLATIRAWAGFALLFLEGLERFEDRLPPGGIQGRPVVGRLPIMVGQADRVAEGIDFPFALMDAGLHLRAVALPKAHLVLVFVEGIGVRVLENAAGLTIDHPGDQLLQGSE